MRSGADSSSNGHTSPCARKRCAGRSESLNASSEGSRDGALGRKLQAEGSSAGDYRFDRIERFVVPHAVKLREHFRQLGRPILHVTIGAALPDASDAPPHMRKLFAATTNYLGSRAYAFRRASRA